MSPSIATSSWHMTMSAAYTFPRQYIISSSPSLTLKLYIGHMYHIKHPSPITGKKHLTKFGGLLFKLVCMKITFFNLFCIELYANGGGLFYDFWAFRGQVRPEPHVFFPCPHTTPLWSYTLATYPPPPPQPLLFYHPTFLLDGPYHVVINWSLWLICCEFHSLHVGIPPACLWAITPILRKHHYIAYMDFPANYIIDGCVMVPSFKEGCAVHHSLSSRNAIFVLNFR